MDNGDIGSNRRNFARIAIFDEPAWSSQPILVAVPFPSAYLDCVPESPARAPEPAYLQGLNPPQREAVLTTEGPVLVLAGAGTGKTAALTARLAHLIATRKAWPSQILAVTFTNKAAREMRERVSALSQGALEGMPWLGTFHSVAARMLRSHAELVGLQSNFTIPDTDDQLRVLKQLIQAANLDEKRWPARQLASLIDRWKNRGWTPRQVDAGESEAFAAGRGADLYSQYQERLKALNACDFGDLLLHMLVVFRTHADVLEGYRERFRYILVDEYQDTNHRNGQVVLHAHPALYTIDRAQGVQQPIGLHANRLGVDIHVIAAEPSPLRNVDTVIRQAHLGVRAIVASPVAAGKSCLSDEERALGVALVELGGGVTNVSVFAGGMLVGLKSLPLRF